MSDFLDRLTARAVGGEATLAPRLPSLFEPAQHAPILPPANDGTEALQRRNAMPSSEAAPAATPLRPPHATSPVQAEALRPAPIAQPAAQMPTPRATSVPAQAPPAALPAMSPTTPTTAMPTVARDGVPQPGPAHAASAAATPVQALQTRIAATHAAAEPVPGGSLLPPPAPVFAMPRSAPEPAQAGHAAALRLRAAQAANPVVAATREPVVHVSIGRIEVRAAPAATTPARRRDEPRPTSLDDYLRQRGKATP